MHGMGRFGTRVGRARCAQTGEFEPFQWQFCPALTDLRPLLWLSLSLPGVSTTVTDDLHQAVQASNTAGSRDFLAEPHRLFPRREDRPAGGLCCPGHPIAAPTTQSVQPRCVLVGLGMLETTTAWPNPPKTPSKPDISGFPSSPSTLQPWPSPDRTFFIFIFILAPPGYLATFHRHSPWLSLGNRIYKRLRSRRPIADSSLSSIPFPPVQVRT